MHIIRKKERRGRRNKIKQTERKPSVYLLLDLDYEEQMPLLHNIWTYIIKYYCTIIYRQKTLGFKTVTKKTVVEIKQWESA
jgi:hypothetical protein